MEKKKTSRSQMAFRNAFLELLKTNLFDSITVTSISEKAGYSKQSFYIYYEDKYDFCDKIIDEEIEEISNTVRKTVSDCGGSLRDTSDIRHLRENVFQHVYKNKELYKAFFRQPCFSNFIPKYMHYLLEDEQLPIFLFSFKNNSSDNLLYLNYICSYIHLAHLNYMVETNFERPWQEMAAMYSQLMKDLDYVTFEKLDTTYDFQLIAKKKS